MRGWIVVAFDGLSAAGPVRACGSALDCGFIHSGSAMAPLGPAEVAELSGCLAWCLGGSLGREQGDSSDAVGAGGSS